MTSQDLQIQLVDHVDFLHADRHLKEEETVQRFGSV